MAFELSFAPEFFLAEGEPYDRNDNAVNKDGNPISVWSALHAMSEDRWRAMCTDLFPDANPDYLDYESVLSMIQETNTCTDLRSPVEVWIDEAGDYTVLVYDGDENR